MSFLDSEESSEGEGGAPFPTMGSRRKKELDLEDGGDDGRLRVNQQFAKSFEKNKREQELQAAKNIDLDDGEDDLESDSESETEDEDAEILTPALDLQIMKTINRIRSKDPDIYDSKKEWFNDEDEDGPSGFKTKKSEKRMRYKDVIREQIMKADTAEDAISSDESDSDTNGGEGIIDVAGRKGLAYDEEQETLRKSLLGSIADHKGGGSGDSDEDDGDDSDDDLLQVRKKTAAEMAQEEEDLRREAEKMKSAGDGGEEDEFLRDFVANRRWLDPTAKETPSYEEILKAPHVEDTDDEEEIDRADEFESKYNFRFEEEGGGEIAMHSRNVPGSMRRKDDKRKRERENRKARKAEERARKEAELRRLKNIKREEIRRRLKAIQEMSGGALAEGRFDSGIDGDERGGNAGVGGESIGAAEALVEGDFDPDKWDAVTGKAFGDGYYEAKDADDGWKPGDDPLAGLGDLDQYNEKEDVDNYDEEEEHDVHGSSNGKITVNGKMGGKDRQGFHEEEADEEWEGGEEDEGWEEGGGEGDEFEGVGAEKEKLLDELYKLDYEDIIGDIPCRFKYTKVKPNDFGLAPEEILLADDKDLNKYVPLKKLAPYRADEPKLDARRRRHLREEVKAREDAAEAEMAALKASKKKRRGRKKSSSAAASGAPNGGGIGDGPATATVADPPVGTEELAGGKRRRRKKGQKKQRAKGEGSGGIGGEQEADLVPRVQPMASSPSDGTAVVGDGDESRNGSGPEKKRGRKRGRNSEDGTGGEMQEDGGIAPDKDSQLDRGVPDDAAVSGNGNVGVDIGEATSIKKTRRGGKGGKGKGGQGKDGGEKRRKKARKADSGAAQSAAVSGVSKSRLASYGL